MSDDTRKLLALVLASALGCASVDDSTLADAGSDLGAVTPDAAHHVVIADSGRTPPLPASRDAAVDRSHAEIPDAASDVIADAAPGVILDGIADVSPDAAQDVAPGDGPRAADGGVPTDPGSAPWVPVSPADVASKCQLDPAGLAAADATLNVPWAIVRHGLLCHEFKSAGMTPVEAWSTTKTMGATVAGMVAWQTRSVPRTGPKTGPFTDEDRVDSWLDSFTYNKDAHVAHVMAMVAQNADLGLGQKTFEYDALGTTQINSMSDILNAVIAQNPGTLGPGLDDFTRRFLYAPLGMTESTWSGGSENKVFAYSWSTTVRDMARLGVLLLHGGMWSGERLLDAQWVYRMTHPSFEDANTGYGYLTWLNASSNFTYGGIPGPPTGLQQSAQLPGPCAPVSVYPTHPHGLSDGASCNYALPYTCAQPLDVGVWQAVGLGGQLIQGHPGLDIVIVARDTTPILIGPEMGSGMAAPSLVWDAVRPAIVAGDPTFSTDTAFCAAYGANTYAPDKAP